jgi:hypothetical protein
MGGIAGKRISVVQIPASEYRDNARFRRCIRSDLRHLLLSI